MGIRGEITMNKKGKIRCIVYDNDKLYNEKLIELAQQIIGIDVIYKGKIYGKVIHTEVVDGKIIWETDGNEGAINKAI